MLITASKNSFKQKFFSLSTAQEIEEEKSLKKIIYRRLGSWIAGV